MVAMPTAETVHAVMTREPVIACVSLGSNLGDAARTVAQAVRDLGGVRLTSLLSSSLLYRTAPWQAEGPDYVNAVALVRTQLCAPDLLLELQALEMRAGRQRPYPNAPRTLDLDLLLYGSGRIESPRLSVPHPRMWARAFVVLPLADVAPQWVSAAAMAAVSDQTIDIMEPVVLPA